MTYFRINPVLALLLLLTAIAAALPFISYAPNRLVSGEGVISGSCGRKRSGCWWALVAPG
ncbi:hypothetical protein FA041_15675 [Escherichia coli]|nr:hypothetical protein [Escherichia coli]MDW9214985.1 hypothetical protein [Escherichia coli]